MTKLWELAMAPFEAVLALLSQIDPQYLLLAVALLIWVQLGRIVRALNSRDSGTRSTDLPERIEELQTKVQSMSAEIADFQAHAAKRSAATPSLSVPKDSGPSPSLRPLTARRDEAL